MKILLLSCADSIHTVRWANEFAKKGNQVLLVSNKNHVAKDSIDERVTIKYLKFGGVLAYYLNSFELRHIYRMFKPDSINVHYASGYGTLARVAGLKPYVLSVWGSDVYVFPNKGFIRRRILKKNVASADSIASTSTSMLNKLKEYCNLDNKKCVITPFGVDTDFFNPVGEKYRIVQNRFIFGSIKKLTYLYGIDYLIKAFKIVHDEWNATKNGLEPFLFVCGNGENIDDFRELSRELGISEHVIISGYIEHSLVPSIIRSIDVFCLSSLSESFGVSALEAMSCQKPVIATDADGFLEIISNNDVGIIVPKADSKAMAEKMLYLYNNPTISKRIGDNARKYVVKKYQWGETAQVLLNALIDLSK